MGIHVLPPNVNESYVNFAAVGSDIRFGLGAVMNVGVNVVDAICRTREDSGSFSSFHDFVKRMPSQALNKRTVLSLIKAGAFDGLGGTRRALAEIHEPVIEVAVKEKRDAELGNVGFDFDELFDAEDPETGGDGAGASEVPDRPEWSRKDKLAFEREMLGLYVSDHPLRGLEKTLATEASMSVQQVQSPEDIAQRDGEIVTVAGLLTSVQHRTAKSGNLYGMAQIEDFTGEMGALFMGKTYQEFGSSLQPDSVVAIRGKLNVRDDGVSLHAHVVRPLDVTAIDDDLELSLTISESRATEEVLEELSRMLDRHAGEAEVRLQLLSTHGVRVFEVPQRVKVSPDLFGEVKGLLGAKSLSPLGEVVEARVTS